MKFLSMITPFVNLSVLLWSLCVINKNTIFLRTFYLAVGADRGVEARKLSRRYKIIFLYYFFSNWTEIFGNILLAETKCMLVEHLLYFSDSDKSSLGCAHLKNDKKLKISMMSREVFNYEIITAFERFENKIWLGFVKNNAWGLAPTLAGWDIAFAVGWSLWG